MTAVRSCLASALNSGADAFEYIAFIPARNGYGDGILALGYCGTESIKFTLQL